MHVSFGGGYFNFCVGSVLGITERGCGGGRGEPEEAVTGKGTEANSSVKTLKGVGERFCYQLLEASQNIKAAPPPVLS